MGHVPLTWLVLLEVDRPLLQLAVLSNLVWRQTLQGRVQCRRKLMVDVEIVRGGDKIREEFPDQCEVQRTTSAGVGRLSIRSEEAIFSRERGTRGQMAVAVFNQPAQKKLP